MFRTSLFALAAMAASISTSAGAQIVSNGSFETPVLTEGEARLFATGASIGAWTVLGSAGNPVAVFSIHTMYGEASLGVTAFNAQNGLNSLDLTGSFNQGLESGVQQTIPTVIGRQYLLSFHVGRASGRSVYATASTVELSIDGGPRAPYTNSNSTPGAVNWQQFTASFVATGPTTTLSFYNGQTTNRFSGLDNVVVTPACAADITFDGSVNVADLLSVITSWGPCAAPPCPADIAPVGGDGQVNVADLLAVITNWGTCP